MLLINRLISFGEAGRFAPIGGRFGSWLYAVLRPADNHPTGLDSGGWVIASDNRHFQTENIRLCQRSDDTCHAKDVCDCH